MHSALLWFVLVTASLAVLLLLVVTVQASARAVRRGAERLRQVRPAAHVPLRRSQAA